MCNNEAVLYFQFSVSPFLLLSSLHVDMKFFNACLFQFFNYVCMFISVL